MAKIERENELVEVDESSNERELDKNLTAIIDNYPLNFLPCVLNYCIWLIELIYLHTSSTIMCLFDCYSLTFEFLPFSFSSLLYASFITKSTNESLNLTT